MLAVVQEAYVLGVSTRRVEDLVEALGVDGLSKSQVSRICAALDAEVEAFRTRSLADETYPDLWLDATSVKVREGGRVVNMAALVAIGVSLSGERRVLGLDLAPGHSEGGAWPGFIRALVERGLSGVRLVISDAHEGLKGRHRQGPPRGRLAALIGAQWRPGPDPSVPVSHRAESALAAAIGFEILLQTRASARTASLAPARGRRACEHRTMSVPGGLAPTARRWHPEQEVES
jgi:hypothetical protein